MRVFSTKGREPGVVRIYGAAPATHSLTHHNDIQLLSNMTVHKSTISV